MSLSAICSPDNFGTLSLFGALVLHIDAAIVSNFTASVPTYRHTPGEQFQNVSGIDFCNVTVSYTHPGQDDEIHVETWLPSPEKWNGRFMGTGGGGWEAGRGPASDLMFMTPAIGDGFAATSTDAGLTPNVLDWALVSEGNVNQIYLHNFLARSLEEQALIGKAVVKLAYNRDAQYSYFTGCSTGGRQGMTLAERYPTLYDDIAADAPALTISKIFPSWIWPHVIMSPSAGGSTPHECEVEAITAAAVEACDELDGVRDGIIAVGVEQCLARFDPFSVVGRTITCTPNLHKDSGDVGQILAVSEAAAKVVNASWGGMLWADGTKAWYGMQPGTDLTGNSPTYADRTLYSIVNMDCRNGTEGEICVGRPNPLGLVWFQYFAAKNPSFNLSGITREEFDRLRWFGEKEYAASTVSEPELAQFHKAGGKMLTYHGTYDQLIPVKDTEHAFESVAARSADIQDFWRFFPVAGLHHCGSGQGSPPYTLLKQLQTWVEEGTAPASSPYDLLDETTGTVHQRLACPFPQKAAFSKECGDPAKEVCWSCAGDLKAAV